MRQYFKLLSGRSLVLPRLLLASMLLLSSCSGLPLKLGGPNVAANTQIGAENRQATIEVGDKVARDLVSKQVDAGTIESVTLNNNNTAPWLLIVALIGWLAPSPSEIGRGIYKLLGGSGR